MNDDSFDTIVKEVLEKHKKTFELAEKDTLEYDITEWLLHHKDGLKEKLKTLHRPAYHLFPTPLLDICLTQYENGAIDIIRQEINSAFNLDPETLLTRVTNQFIRNIASELLSL